jgi:hypothetical protein
MPIAWFRRLRNLTGRLHPQVVAFSHPSLVLADPMLGMGSSEPVAPDVPGITAGR